jgi:hypothetical protein
VASKDKLRIVFLAYHTTSDGKSGHVFVSEDSFTEGATYDEVFRTGMVWGLGNRTYIVGGIYESDGDVDDETGRVVTFRFTNAQYKGSVNHPVIAESEARIRAKREHDRQVALEKKMKQQPYLAKEVDYLRMLRASLPWKDQAMFDVLVLQAIRRPK